MMGLTCNTSPVLRKKKKKKQHLGRDPVLLNFRNELPLRRLSRNYILPTAVCWLQNQRGATQGWLIYEDLCVSPFASNAGANAF